MSSSRIVRSLVLPLAAWLAAAAWTSPARGEDCSCGRGGSGRSKFSFFGLHYECKGPACDICKMPQYGFHFPNWRPFPSPVGAPHAPAAGVLTLNQAPTHPPQTPPAVNTADEQLPKPRKTNGTPEKED
jgi:hypothetical protein